MHTSSRSHPVRLPFARKLEIHSEIAKHITPGNDGYCTYKEEMTDRKLAKILGCSFYVIRDIRQDTFGKLQSPQGGMGPNWAVTITALNVRIAAIEKFITSLDDTWAKDL